LRQIPRKKTHLPATFHPFLPNHGDLATFTAIIWSHFAIAQAQASCLSEKLT
jgi:hypothetical protein